MEQQLTIVERGAIAAFAQKKVTQYRADELATELKSVLKWAAADAGARIAEEESQYITVRTAELLARHYTTLSLADVRFAFELCLTGDLDQYLPKSQGQPDRSCYGQFNAAYICKVLNAYLAMRSDALRKAEKNKTAPERRPSEEEERKAREEILARLYSCFDYYAIDSTLRSSLIDERLFYDLLAEGGLVTKTDQPIARDINGSMSKAGKDAPYARERRKAIKTAFNSLIAQDKDIREIVR